MVFCIETRQISSGDGVFHLVILALANFDYFSLVPDKVTGWWVKNDFCINLSKKIL